MKLNVDIFDTSVKTQFRGNELFDDKVSEYAELLKEGILTEPIIAVHDKVLLSYYLVDGYHRCAAARKAGISELEAKIIEGDAKMAIWLSLGANCSHGIPLQAGEKKKRIQFILECDLFQDKKITEIAELTGTSRQYVHIVKNEIEARKEDEEAEDKPTADDGCPIVVVDENGEEVPYELQDAFAMRGEIKSLRNRIKDISLAFDELIGKPGSERFNTPEIDRLFTTINKELKNAPPHALCMCKGSNEYCDMCDGSGWLTLRQYNLIKKG